MDENTPHNKAYTFLPAGLVVVVAAVVLFVLAVVVGFTVGLVFLSAMCPVVGNEDEVPVKGSVSLSSKKSSKNVVQNLLWVTVQMTFKSLLGT